MRGSFQFKLLRWAAAAVFVGGVSAQALAQAQPSAAAARTRLSADEVRNIQKVADTLRAHNFDEVGRQIVIETRPEGLGNPCVDGQFVEASWRTGRATGGEGLLNRHVDCRISRTAMMDFQAVVVKNKDGSYRFARKDEKQPTESLTFGQGIIETRVQSWGAPSGLRKRHRVDTRIIKYKAKDGYKGPRPAGLVIRPYVGCLAFFTPNETCSVPTSAQLGFFKPLFGSTDWVGKSFIARFDWTKVQPEPTVDFADFQVYLGAFFYAAAGNTAPVEGTGILYDTDMIGWPVIRCDRGMAVNGGDGCVHPEAASVVRLSKSSSVIGESATHIEEAMAGVSPGMSNGAPGSFHLRPGTRAVADAGTPLTRKAVLIPGETKDSAVNRHESCGKQKSSIISTFPNASASCTGPGICSCDEYPYNASWEGGYFARWATSAKMIPKLDNSTSGTLMQQQVHWDRVLDLSTPTDQKHGGEFWVEVLQ